MHQINISPTSTSNSEAFTSESPAKIDGMTPGTTCTVIHNYIFKFPITDGCVTDAKGLIHLLSE